MPDTDSPALILDDLMVMRGDVALCGALNMAVHAGEIWHIVGPNGTGKTTLLMMLAGLLPIQQGRLHWQGRAAQEWSTLYVGHLSGLNSSLSVLQNLQFLANLSQQNTRISHIDDALMQVGLAGYEDVPVARLSSGQKRRVGLARLWLDPVPALWLLDEPLTALDVAMVERLNTRITQHAAQGGRVMLTSHQPVACVTHTVDLAQHVVVAEDDR
jgi:heme exporter protein A